MARPMLFGGFALRNSSAPEGAADHSPRREPWDSVCRKTPSPVRGGRSRVARHRDFSAAPHGAFYECLSPLPHGSRRGLSSAAPSGAFPKTKASCQKSLPGTTFNGLTKLLTRCYNRRHDPEVTEQKFRFARSRSGFCVRKTELSIIGENNGLLFLFFRR